jgi:hypothetical protein
MWLSASAFFNQVWVCCSWLIETAAVLTATSRQAGQAVSLSPSNAAAAAAAAAAVQYYRVYSPVTFGKKYDPEGRFIRRFVPQLAQFPSKYIYEPHMAPREVQQR